MNAPLNKSQLDEIATRAAHLYEYVPQTDDAGQLAGEDVPALIAEIERMKVEHERESMALIGERDNCEWWADKLAAAVGPDELIGEHSSHNNPWLNALDLITPHAEVQKLRARAAELEAELAKYVGHEPTLDEEARFVHEQELRKRIARDVNRAGRPTFAASEDPELVVKTTRAIDIRLVEMGDQAPYWVPEGGEQS